MKNRIVAFLFLFIALGCIFVLRNSKADVVKSKYFNYVEKGGRTVKTSPSTQYKLMESYPQSTVTVYEAGTLDLAPIWSDKDGLSIKANPFTADTDGFFYFYADCGKYDIKFSGTGISVPYTWGDVFVCNTIGSGTGNVSTLGGTENFITKWTSDTEIGDSVIYNPANLQIASSILFGWTSGSATGTVDIAIARDSAGKLEINSGTLNDLESLTLHRIEPIPTATIPGLNFGVIADDPTNPVVGDCWYNTSLSAFRCFNGSTFTLATGSGITSINALTAAAQLLVVGTSGNDFNISSATATHTFNLPNAGASARGVVSTAAQTFAGKKTFTPTGTFSGFNFGVLAGDPATVVDGDCWYNSVLAKYRCVENGTVTNVIIGGATINPTNNFMPYRINATTFGDSNLVRTSATVTTINPSGGAGFIRGPENVAAAPTYSFTNAISSGMWLEFKTFTTPFDTAAVGISAEQHTIMQFLFDDSGSTSAEVAIMRQNNHGVFGFGNNGVLGAGIQWGDFGVTQFISDTSNTSGSFFSKTAEIDSPIGCDSGNGRAVWLQHGNVRTVNLTANRTVCATVTNGGVNGSAISGVIVTLIVIQDATGSRTITWHSTYKWVGGVAPTLTTTANAKDIFVFWWDGTNMNEVSRALDVK